MVSRVNTLTYIMVFSDFSTLNIYAALAVNGIFTGLGTAIGSYLATKHILKKTERLVRKIRGSIK